jgi:hypothetical protein
MDRGKESWTFTDNTSWKRKWKAKGLSVLYDYKTSYPTAVKAKPSNCNP